MKSVPDSVSHDNPRSMAQERTDQCNFFQHSGIEFRCLHGPGHHPATLVGSRFRTRLKRESIRIARSRAVSEKMIRIGSPK